MLKKYRYFLFILTYFISSSGVVAQNAQLVKDVNTSSLSGDPQINIFSNTANVNYVINNDRLFYVRFTPDFGAEPWVTDLTNGTTTLLRDINPGTKSASIAEMVSVGTSVVFSANDGIHGTELWTSDGTPGGTVLVRDINVNLSADSSSPHSFAPFGSKVYFTADDGIRGRELWVSDLTGVGTKLLVDLAPGSNSSDPNNIIAVNSSTVLDTKGGLYMSASVSSGGYQLVKVSFDGLTITPFGTAYGASNLTLVVKGQIANPIRTLFMLAYDQTHGRELWVSDLTVAGTHMVQDLTPGSADTNLNFRISRFGSKVIFGAEINDTNTEPCVSDGNTITCFDVNPGVESSNPAGFATIGGVSTFIATNKNFGRELWKTDGATFSQVADIAPGNLNGLNYTYFNSTFNGEVYFTGDDHISGNELWKSDGTNTSLVKDIFPGAAGSDTFILGSTSSGVIFVAREGQRRLIWRSDGTSAGTVPLFDLSVNSTANSYPYTFFSASNSNNALFGARTEELGFELWNTDGTTPGTSLLKDLAPGNRSLLFTIGNLGSTGLFENYDGDEQSVWHTDGTAAGTVRLPQPKSIRFSGRGNDFAQIGGTTLFSGQSDLLGAELWRSDGTPTGTQLVKDIYTGPNDSDISNFAVLNGKAILSANDGVSGQELWTTDGTTGGTKLLADLLIGGDSSPTYLTLLNNTLLFAANFGGNTGTELGITDGTPGGTKVLKDIFSGPGSSLPGELTPFGTQILFAARTGGSGYSLMKTDGTPGGTIPVLAASPSFGIPSPGPMAVLGNRAFFLAADLTHGEELWATDGTAAGTVLVKDIYAGGADSSPNGFVVADNLVYFSATDATHGQELWRTDGTEAGTVLVEDIYPGEKNGSPNGFFPFRGNLYFSANGRDVGVEPWKVVFDECPDDPSKKLAGFCGCGVAESDSNNNGIQDCLGNADLLAQLTQIQKLLGKVKPTSKKKALKKLKQNIAAEKILLSSLTSFSQSQLGFVQIKSKRSLTALVKDVNKFSRSALNFKSSKFKANKAKALKAIGVLKKALK